MGHIIKVEVINTVPGTAICGSFSYQTARTVARAEDGEVVIFAENDDRNVLPAGIVLSIASMDELAMEWLYVRGLIDMDTLIEARGGATI